MWHDDEDDYTEQYEDEVEDELDSVYLEDHDPSDVTSFYPQVTKPVSDGVNLERSGDYSKVRELLIAHHTSERQF